MKTSPLPPADPPENNWAICDDTQSPYLSRIMSRWHKGVRRKSDGDTTSHGENSPPNTPTRQMSTSSVSSSDSIDSDMLTPPRSPTENPPSSPAGLDINLPPVFTPEKQSPGSQLSPTEKQQTIRSPSSRSPVSSTDNSSDNSDLSWTFTEPQTRGRSSSFGSLDSPGSPARSQKRKPPNGLVRVFDAAAL